MSIVGVLHLDVKCSSKNLCWKIGPAIDYAVVGETGNFKVGAL